MKMDVQTEILDWSRRVKCSPQYEEERIKNRGPMCPLPSLPMSDQREAGMVFSNWQSQQGRPAVVWRNSEMGEFII